MSNIFDHIAEKVGIVVQGGNVSVGELHIEREQKIPRSKFELLLLDRLKAEVESRFLQSLHYKILVSLDKDLKPQLVSRFWEKETKLGEIKGELLSNETTILDVFDRPDVNGKLLILGAPGSGKTTALLELAEALINRSQTDSEQPVPVILSINSWNSDEKLILDWILSELKEKYGVPINVGRHLISQNRLIILLDGLDETAYLRQKEFIKRLNLFVNEDFQPQYMVVTSRQKEYESHQERLKLNGAIVCQPLTTEKIEQYFLRLERPDLFEMVRENKKILDILKTPLFLNIFFVAYRNLSNKKVRDLISTESYESYLLDAYVKQTFLKLDLYFKSKIDIRSHLSYRQWLSWIAKVLEDKAQSEFIVDDLQPHLLSSRKQLRLYGLLTHCFIGSFLFLSYYLSPPSAPFSILLPCLGYLLSLISPIETTTALIILRSQIYICILVLINLSFTESNILLGVIAVTLFAVQLIDGLAPNIRIEMFDLPKLSLIPISKEIFLSFLGGFIATIPLTLVSLPSPYNSVYAGLDNAFYVSLIFLGNSSLFLLSYGLIGRIFSPVETVRNNIGEGFHNSLKSSIIAFVFFGLTPSITIMGIIAPMAVNILVCSPTLEELKALDLRNLSLLYDMHDFVLDNVCNKEKISLFLKFLLVSTFSSFMSSGVYFSLLFGGVASLQYGLLLFLLFLNGSIPFKYFDFLEASNQCLILQRVGERYFFAHKLLQEHFAAMSLKSPKINNN